MEPKSASEARRLMICLDEIDFQLSVASDPLSTTSFLIDHMIAKLIPVRPFREVQRLLLLKGHGLEGFCRGQEGEQRP